MKRQATRTTSALLILAMLLTLWTPLTANAATAVTIAISNLNNVSAPLTGDENKPSSGNTIDTFTTNPITITANFAGIPDNQVQGIYLRITNTTTLKVSEDKTIKPVQNGSEITFSNVLLTQGLNKIELKHDSFGYTSVPGWANFSAAMSISDLALNEQPLVENSTVLKTGNLQSITGTAANADEITLYLNGDAYYPASFARNKFTFYFNTGRVSDMKLKPGNNELTFVAKQGNNTYSLKRKFIYDNGAAYPYDIAVSGLTSPLNWKEVIQRPSIETEGITDVSVRMKLKTITSAVYDYEYAYISLAGMESQYKVRYDFINKSFSVLSSSASPVLNSGNAGTNILTPPVVVSGDFATHDIKIDLPIAVGSQTQILKVQYEDTNYRLDPVEELYYFDFVDKNKPYIDGDVQLIVDEANNRTVALNKPDGSTQINRFPSKLRVLTKNSTQVLVRVNGQPYDDQDPDTANSGGLYTITPYDVASGTGMAEVTLKGISDGQTLLEVIPYDGSGAWPASTKTYNLQISSSPLLILDNVYNGMVITNKDQLRCGLEQPCISGRLMNRAGAPVDVMLNGYTLTPDFDPAAPESFKISNTQLNASGALEQDGKKVLTFTIKVGTQEVVFKYEFFIISDNGPSITMFDLDYNVSDPRFVKTTTGYTTTATQINLVGQVVRGTMNPVITMSVQLPGTSTESVLTTTETNISDTPRTVQIRLDKYDFPANTYGEFIFTLKARANNGSEIRQQVRIKREPQPYRIIDPLSVGLTLQDLVLVKNSAGKSQLNINKNYMTLYIYAEKATKVLVGKEEAAEQKAYPGLFRYDVKNLKAGANEIKFTIVRGDNQQAGSIVLNNTNTAIEGLQYKAKMANSFNVFSGDIKLTFPKDTKLIRNDRNDKFITSERSLLFGIASTVDGRVEKSETPAFKDFLVEKTGRFRPASKRYWIDAGTIEDISDVDPERENLMTQALVKGGGRLPTERSDINSALGQFHNRDIKYLVVPSKPGTLTLKFDSIIRDEAWRYLSVFQYNVFENPNGGLMPRYPNGEWKNLGGVVNTKDNSITVSIDSFGYFQVMYMDNGFGDLDTASNKHWAKLYIEALYSKGIMRSKDTEPNRFLPDEYITRGEFVQMLVSIFDLPLENPDTRVDTSDRTYNGMFFDVPRGSDLRDGFGLYDFKHIEAAARAGIVRGTAGNIFGHDQTLTRSQAALMIARASDLKLITDVNKASQALQKAFTDGVTITDPEFVPAIEAVTKAKLMDGIPNDLLEGQTKTTVRFDGGSNITRAQAAAIAYRVLQQQKKFPK
ncbi:S-layer homology domain-containing protein [Paenibacillus sp. UNCCL117]|uniref:S-layer homology domain-containing protein n=1 Tax=unclassified Paenibacillus TaxID=185978 RepID=UPI00088021AC|nr:MULTISPECIES: S-layer homology domain-containing protein [unclassified Paenibacillus]SDE34829.1 S-layer homology domain-containing protein [Paenibacillus sp. cl123]SFW64362.1 S-layer homology domain-containing protein [Paenibacillus sp. UNCCL117]